MTLFSTHISYKCCIEVVSLKNRTAVICAYNIKRLIASHEFQFREKQPLECVSISGGVATFPFDGNMVEEIIKHADDALYTAKASGRNCIMKYELQHLL